MSILDILNQYANPATAPSGNVAGHFDAVAQQAAPAELGGGIAAALRSAATPSFGQTVGALFGRSNPDQQAGLLNQLVNAIGPSGLNSAGGGILGRLLGGAGGGVPQISPAQAAQVSPEDVSSLAAHAEQQNGGVIDQIGNFYAQHPTLVKSLGVAALATVMSHMGRQHA